MDFNTFNQKKKPKSPTQATNFIEALKDIGSSAKQQAKDVVFGPSQPRTQSGELKSDAPFDFENYLRSREKKVVSREKQRYQHQIKEERLIFHRKQEESKLQIKVIQEELKKLIDVSSGLSVEIKKAVFTSVVNPGTYHENFFDRIKRLIKLARKKISESKNWMEIFNHRSKKRSHYWFNAKKSGTKYTLSQERSVATRVG